MQYHKLVRDKIIDSIEAKGEIAVWHIAIEEEYREKLTAKLIEEVNEFSEAPSQEEMADIFEVITGILTDRGWTIEDIVAVQKEKREKRGGFERRIILDES